MVLEAAAVAADRLDDLNCVVVVFAENADGSGHVLELQRALTFDDQDRSLGQDTYCICVDGGPTAYGGVLRVELTPTALSLEFTSTVAQTLGLDDAVRVEFAITAPLFDKLREDLAYVFSVDRDPPTLVGIPHDRSK